MKGTKLIICLSVIFFFCAISVKAQKNFGEDAERAYTEERYFEAIELYKKAYSKERNKAKKAEIIFQIAQCYRLTLEYKQAQTWYAKSIKANYPDPIAILYQADAMKVQGNYPEAIVEYNNYKAAVPSDKRGEDGAKSSELAQTWKDDPSRYVVNPETQLNSKQYDFSPTYADKKYNTLIFTSTREGSTGKDIDGRLGESFSDLYEAKRDKNGKWSTPSVLNDLVNSPANEGAASVNRKGNLLYFTRCGVEKNEVLGCKIYTAQKRGTNWMDPALVNLAQSDTITVGHPSISKDEKTLFFSSDMDGGFGGKDIWMSNYDKKTKLWSEPVNLGASVNTDGNEMFPFIHDDGTLYFASDGHLGMGGLDIFRAEKLGEGSWGNVANMKYPINSAAHDYGIIFEGTKERGFFTSSREGSKGGDDIFSFVLPPLLFVLQGTITDVETKAPLEGATVKIIGTDGTAAEVTTDASGGFFFADNGNDRYLNINTSYEITVSAKDYLNGKGKETTVGLTESTTFIKDFALQTTVKKGKAVDIKFPEVQYDLGKATLRPESKDSLNYLYTTLIDNPTIVVELSAHTDSRGSDKENQKLSEDRAKSCVEYLIEKGIDSTRMMPVGYGERVLLIGDKEIAKLKSKEEKEAAHQKNRRTVFKVLRSDFVPAGGLPEEPALTPKKNDEDEEDLEDEEGIEEEEEVEAPE